MDIQDIQNIRLKAFEELRQEMKWVHWPISSLLLLERAIEELSKELPDNRYTRG